MKRAWVGVAVTLLLAGAAVADRLRPPQPVEPATVHASNPGGVWACPVMKLAGANGWLHLFNSGDDASAVRISYVPDRGATVEQALTLAPHRTLTAGTPRAMLAADAGAIVEYAGGRVTVSRTVSIGGAAGAASCDRPGGATLIVPQGSTFTAETQLVLLNPGAADAVVDVALLTNGRSLQPQSLSGRVVPARHRLVIRAGDYAFDARAVAAQITTQAGRVVVDGILTAGSTADLIQGVPPSAESATVASSARGGVLFGVVAIGDEDAVGSGRLLAFDGASTFPPLVTSLAPDTPIVSAAGASHPGAIGLAVESSTSPLVIGARWQVVTKGNPGEVAMSTGVTPSHEVLAVLGPPAASGAMRLLIANTDTAPASIDIVVFTEAGPAKLPQLQGIALEPGRSATLTLQGLSPSATVGLQIRSSGGRVVAALEATTAAPTFTAYAVTAVPTENVPVVGVEPDPRRGVPAS